MATDDADYIGVSELAAAVGEALSEFAQIDKRMKSGATEIPTERTIRFYLEKGLLPKPSKRLGQTLVFGRVHLLHLLVIKKLQADGVPLSAIPDILKKKGKTEAQLEELLKEDVQIFRSRRSLDEFRQRTGHTDDSDVVVSYPHVAMRPTFRSERSDETAPDVALSDLSEEDEPSARTPLQHEAPEVQLTNKDPHQSSGAKSYLKSLLSRSPRTPARRGMQMKLEEPDHEILFSRIASPPAARWTRHEPADGLEINIGDDYRAPEDEEGKAKLLEKLRNILGL